MLSTTSEYAIRALGSLASLKAGEVILGRDLATASDIPSNYLAKILGTLNKSGFVEASRGPGGGYRLKRPADQISLTKVIAVFESNTEVKSCIFTNSSPCSDNKPCAAHPRWLAVHEAYLNFIEKTTIEMIAKDCQIEQSKNKNEKVVEPENSVQKPFPTPKGDKN